MSRRKSDTYGTSFYSQELSEAVLYWLSCLVWYQTWYNQSILVQHFPAETRPVSCYPRHEYPWRWLKYLNLTLLFKVLASPRMKANIWYHQQISHQIIEHVQVWRQIYETIGKSMEPNWILCVINLWTRWTKEKPQTFNHTGNVQDTHKNSPDPTGTRKEPHSTQCKLPLIKLLRVRANGTNKRGHEVPNFKAITCWVHGDGSQ